MRKVRVTGVEIPAMSTIGRCAGIDIETGEIIVFGADHRPARKVGEALQAAMDEGVEPPVAAVEDWQVLSVTDPEEVPA